ncbi:MAG: hypothetical protein AAF152_05355 [Cyanobacteria bacterium P01_A01_bin.114]
MNRFLRYLSVPLLAGMLTAGLWGVTSEVSAADWREGLKQAEAAETEPEEDDFLRAMRLGYAYAQQFDYNTALINFRRALELRPGNPYAEVAIQNMEYFIERDRNEARQREIDRLEARLTQSADAKDWVCAAGTVDELVAYTEPESLNRERLVGYRGELTGLLDSRTDFENWSTVCTPESPLF